MTGGKSDFIDVVFDVRPGPVSPGRFIKVADPTDYLIRGKWIERPDGTCALRIQRSGIEQIVRDLHDSEINGEISWFYDGCWTVKLGDPTNGIVAQETVTSLDAAAEWLRENAMRLYPNSEFARERTSIKGEPA